MLWRFRCASLLVALAAFACDGARGATSVPEDSVPRVSETEPPVSETEPPVEVEPHAADSDGPCRLEQLSRPVLRGLSPATRAAAIAVSGTRAFVVAATGDERLEVASLDLDSEDATASRASVAFAGARALLALEPVDTERAIALTQTPCPDGEQAARCLRALLLGADATAIGEPVVVPLPAEIRTRRIASAGRSIYVLRSHARGAPGIDIFDAGERGLTHRRVSLAQGIPLTEESVEVMALAVADGAWAVLYRHGAAEDPRSAVVLATHMDEHAVPELAEALVVESFAWSAGALSLVVSLEFARPSLLRLGADGELVGQAVLLTRGETLPPPFATRRVAALRGRGAQAAIEIRDGGGDRIGEPIAVGSPSFVFADFASVDRGFAVALATRVEGGEVDVSLRRVRCSPRGAH